MAETTSYATDSDCEGVFFDAIDSRLRFLPTELVQVILLYATDAFSLKNLAQCRSSFHRAFLANQDSILQIVLRNEISADVLPDALVTFASARLLLGVDFKILPCVPHEERDYLRDLRQIAELGPVSWSMPKALAISKLHRDVNFFASEFAATLTTSPIISITSNGSKALKPKEIERIERSFYRYELFCNLLRKGDLDTEDKCRQFFNKFAPWENEQLASVYEYLFGSAFNDVAQHDVEWGERYIPWLNDESPPQNYYKEHLLSLGLNYLRRLVTASTYEERYKLLELEPEENGLHSALCVALDANDDFPLADLTEKERAQYIMSPYSEDSDIGPAEAWRWAYQAETTSGQYFMSWQRQLRRFGYVMYDYDRLCSWPEFHKPFNSPYKDDPKVRRCNFEGMMDSWKKREEVWLNGGRGWWSEEDTTKLVWPYLEVRKKKVENVRLDKWGFPPPGIKMVRFLNYNDYH